MLDSNFAENKSVAGALDNHGHGAHEAKKNPPSMMSNHLRDELIRILQAGDEKNDGAFTVAVAARIEKFIVAAREILMTENLAANDLGSLVAMRSQSFNNPYSLGSFGPGALPLPSINNENFGVQAIRQLVDAARTMGESPAKLVDALAIARANNLTDVAEVLEKKLGISKDSAPEGEAGSEAVS